MDFSNNKEKDKQLFSFEVFPPKKDSNIETIYKTLEELKDLNPDFISVTYGAGGREAGNSKTCEIASIIKDKYNIIPVAHLTCVNSSKAEVDAELTNLKKHGIKNILALRGDIVPDIERKNDFAHASDLINYINEHSQGYFEIFGACYPEVHVDAPDIITDISNLKKKVEAGAGHLISQLFFDNGKFYDFCEKARIAGINVPIEAGIMPVTNKKQIERMVTMCGASLPSKFVKVLQRYEYAPEALRDAGIAYAIDQIVDLLSNGVDGIHLYTMNNPYVAKKINDAVRNLFL
ncbi:MAG: methylenetetrahydrofolate reductase [NAD(P)H] [Lachnospiraceae bacterium]|nr:methylenetetrahydrofolate reductase [NAD(P)H] [Lachnospiraceae bacterium]